MKPFKKVRFCNKKFLLLPFADRCLATSEKLKKAYLNKYLSMVSLRWSIEMAVFQYKNVLKKISVLNILWEFYLFLVRLICCM